MHCTTMKKAASIALLSLTAACAPYSDGYYDANGTYHPYNSYNTENHARPPIPGGTYDSSYAAPAATTTTVTRTYRYDRPGYYDSNGYYIASDSGPNVPEDLFPPRGMCRVWFADRTPAYQPPVESCHGIQERVPAGAYVIYGG